MHCTGNKYIFSNIKYLLKKEAMKQSKIKPHVISCSILRPSSWIPKEKQEVLRHSTVVGSPEKSDRFSNLSGSADMRSSFPLSSYGITPLVANHAIKVAGELQQNDVLSQNPKDKKTVNASTATSTTRNSFAVFSEQKQPCHADNWDLSPDICDLQSSTGDRISSSLGSSSCIYSDNLNIIRSVENPLVNSVSQYLPTKRLSGELLSRYKKSRKQIVGNPFEIKKYRFESSKVVRPVRVCFNKSLQEDISRNKKGTPNEIHTARLKTLPNDINRIYQMQAFKNKFRACLVLDRCYYGKSDNNSKEINIVHNPCQPIEYPVMEFQKEILIKRAKHNAKKVYRQQLSRQQKDAKSEEPLAI